MSRLSGIDRRLGLPLASSLLLACALGVAYFMWLKPNPDAVGQLVVFALLFLCLVVTFLAAGTIAIVHGLHERIERLEQRQGISEAQ